MHALNSRCSALAAAIAHRPKRGRERQRNVERRRYRDSRAHAPAMRCRRGSARTVIQEWLDDEGH